MLEKKLWRLTIACNANLFHRELWLCSRNMKNCQYEHLVIMRNTLKPKLTLMLFFAFFSASTPKRLWVYLKYANTFPTLREFRAFEPKKIGKSIRKSDQFAVIPNHKIRCSSRKKVADKFKQTHAPVPGNINVFTKTITVDLVCTLFISHNFLLIEKKQCTVFFFWTFFILHFFMLLVLRFMSSGVLSKASNSTQSKS